MTRETLLAALPEYDHKLVLIKRRQTVEDILIELLYSHELFERDYDTIATKFLGGSDVEVLKRIFNFLKLNVDYKEEGDSKQVIKSPAAIIETGVCDCKCYASFIGGVLDAINRVGGRFNWNYAFASYQKGVRVPGHVFVQAYVDGEEYWIDPVPAVGGFDSRTPSPKFIRRKQKVDAMALYRLSGIGEVAPVRTTLDRLRYPVSVKDIPVLSNQEALDTLRNTAARVLENRAAPVPKTGFNIGEFIKQNPLVSAAVVGTVILLLTAKRKRK